MKKIVWQAIGHRLDKFSWLLLGSNAFSFVLHDGLVLFLLGLVGFIYLQGWSLFILHKWGKGDEK